MEEMFTIEEVAQKFKTSKSTIERYIREKKLDAVLLGNQRNRRVTATQLAEFINRRTPVVKRMKFKS